MPYKYRPMSVLFLASLMPEGWTDQPAPPPVTQPKAKRKSAKV